MLIFSTWVANARTRLLDAGLAGGNIISDNYRPSKDDELPVAHVSIGSDDGKSDGDPRVVGAIRLDHTTSLTVEVLDVGNDGFELKDKLNAHAETILSALLPNMLGWCVESEGLARVSTIYEAPPEGSQVTGRVMVSLDILSHTEWPFEPEDLPDLTTVSIDAGNGIGANVSVPTE